MTPIYFYILHLSKTFYQYFLTGERGGDHFCFNVSFYTPPPPSQILIFTNVRGIVRRHRQKSDTARLATNTFLNICIFIYTLFKGPLRPSSISFVNIFSLNTLKNKNKICGFYKKKFCRFFFLICKNRILLGAHF